MSWFYKKTIRFTPQESPELEKNELDTILDCMTIALMNMGIIKNPDQAKYVEHYVREQLETISKK